MPFLVLPAAVLGAAVAARGGAAGDVWAACEALTGIALVAVVFAEARARRITGQAVGFPKAALLLPLYALFQILPLPPGLVALLSPARVELHAAVAAIAGDAASWMPLSVRPAATVRFAVRLGAYAALFWIVRWLAMRLGRHGFVAAGPILAVAAVQAALALSVANPAGAAGSYVNRNHLAGLLEMALPFAVVAAGFVVARLPGGRRNGFAAAGVLLSGAAVILLGAGILVTRSRAGLAAALFGLFVVGIVVVARVRAARRRRLAWAVSLPVLLGAVFIYLPSDNLVRRYGALAAQQGIVHEGRMLLWRESAELAAAYPIVGCGFGAYESAFLRYKRSAPMVNDDHAHNDYLELLAETGILGIVLCAALVAAPVIRVLRASLNGALGFHHALGLACLGSLATIAAHSFVDFNLRIPANGLVFFWILGMSSACGRAAANSTPADHARS